MKYILILKKNVYRFTKKQNYNKQNTDIYIYIQIHLNFK